MSPADAVVLAHRDAKRLPVKTATYTRYLFVGHVEVRERQAAWAVLSAHVNHLSRERLIQRPVILLDDGSERDGLAVNGPQLVRPIAANEWPRAVLLRLNTLYYDLKGKFWLQAWETLPSPHFTALLQKEIITVKPGTQSYGYFVRRSDGRPVTTTWAEGQNDAGLRWVETKTVPVQTQVKKVAFVILSAPWLPPVEYAELSALTQSKVPVVLGDWFLWQTGMVNDREGAGSYYDFLGIKDEKTYHEAVGFDEKVFKQKFAEFINEARAAVARSRVLKQPRRIVRFQKIGGALLATYDNRLATNRIVKGKKEFRNPLNTLGNEFQFDGTEQFGHLANGLWAVYAGDAQGKSLASAPDFLGYDKTSNHNLGRIEAGISCWRCHTNGGVQDFEPYHQRLYGKGQIHLVSPDERKLIEAQQQYFQAMTPLFDDDRRVMARALLQCNGLEPKKWVQQLSARWAYYDGDVDMARACRELGTTPAEFQAALRAYLSGLTGDQVLANWLLPAEAQDEFIVDTWHEQYPAAQLALFAHRQIMKQGYKPPNLDSPECKKWATNHGGKFPAYEKAGKFFSWSEACKAAGVETAGWPLPAAVRGED